MWYTGDAGEHWVPLRGWGYNRNYEVASGLACGSLLVHFGASAAYDFVMVGTGDPANDDTPTEPTRWGVGVLWATGPADHITDWLDDRMNFRPPDSPPLQYYLPIVRMARHPDAYPQLSSPTTLNGRLWQEDRVVALVGPDEVYLGTWHNDPTYTWQSILTQHRVAGRGEWPDSRHQRRRVAAWYDRTRRTHRRGTHRWAAALLGRRGVHLGHDGLARSAREPGDACGRRPDAPLCPWPPGRASGGGGGVAHARAARTRSWTRSGPCPRWWSRSSTV